MQKLPIVILHGWNLSREKYKNLSALLFKKGFSVYSPDLPGFGKSEIPKKVFTLSDYVAFVEQYMKRNKIKRAIILGHSFGGRVAIKLAAANPQKIASLILTGVPGFLPASRAKIAFFLFLSKIGKKLFGLPGLTLFEESARRILYKFARASDYQRTEGIMREAFKSIIKEDLILSMKQIACPALLIWGEKDGIVSEKIGKKMAKLVKLSKLVIIPNTRHGLPWTHPDIFVAEVEKFLANLS